MVDHDHDTGEIRQLLCNTCNTIIGYSRMDTRLLMRCIEYIDKYPGGH